jgi:predicted flap endonuclease-1-like 5' DNA nuclease
VGRVTELEEQLAAARSELDARERELGAAVREATRASARTEALEAELGARGRAGSRTTLRARGSARKRPTRDLAVDGDDLSELRGVGPRLRDRLEDAGYRSFAALAAAQSGELAEALGVTRARVEREGWIEEARRRVAPAAAEADPTHGEPDEAPAGDPAS